MQSQKINLTAKERRRDLILLKKLINGYYKETGAIGYFIWF